MSPPLVDSPSSPYGQAPAAPAAGSGPAIPPLLPPPLPRAVLPLYDHDSARPARPRWPAAAAFVAAAVYFAGMLALNAARDRPAGPPSANDLLLACGVFPLALIVGGFLLCGAVAAALVTAGRARLLGVLAAAIIAAAFVLAFPSA